MTEQFLFKDKILFLRLHRLGHLPPAKNAAEMLWENRLPLLVVEYGHINEEISILANPIPKRRLSSPWARFVPRIIRPQLMNAVVVLRLAIRFWVEGRPLLVVAHGIQEQWAVWLLKCLTAVPTAVHVHEIFSNKELGLGLRFFFWAEGRALRKAQFLVFPEKTRSEIYTSEYRCHVPVYVVPNCPRLRHVRKSVEIRKELNIPPQAVVLAYLGGIGRENMIEEGIRAIRKLPDVHFIIWGWGDAPHLSHLQSVAGGLAIANRVHFAGQLGNDKLDYLESCDIAYCIYQPILRRYQFAATASNKLMEAMACGLPVITSGEADFRAIVETHNVGVATKDYSIDTVEAAIGTLANDKALRLQKGKNARRLHEEFFNFEKQFAPVLEKYGTYVRFYRSTTQESERSGRRISVG